MLAKCTCISSSCLCCASLTSVLSYSHTTDLKLNSLTRLACCVWLVFISALLSIFEAFFALANAIVRVRILRAVRSGSQDHYARDCPQSSSLHCSKCNRAGHVADECRTVSRRGRGGGSGRQWRLQDISWRHICRQPINQWLCTRSSRMYLYVRQADVAEAEHNWTPILEALCLLLLSLEHYKCSVRCQL